VGIYAEPSATNCRHFFVKIAGPSETPFEGGMFDLELFLPEEYPMVPPKVLFRTKIYHPNIDKLGKFSVRTLVASLTTETSDVYFHLKLKFSQMSSGLELQLSLRRD